MRRSVKHIFLGAILAVLLYLPVSADDAMMQFNRAYTLFNTMSYEQADEIFSSLVENYPEHAYADQFLFFKGKSAFYLNRFGEASDALKQVIDRYPDSKYLPYAYYFRGNALYRQGKTDRAFGSYLNAYIKSPDNELDQLAGESLKSSAVGVSVEELTKLKTAPIPDEKRCPLLIGICENLLNRGDYQLVTSLLDPCTSPQANYLKRRARDFLENKMEIGIILPMSGELKRYGDQILDGAMLRIEEYEAETGRKIKPVLYDSRGDNLEAARIVKMLANSGMAAAVGPLTSEESAVASASLSCGDMPLIIPAASQGGITELSNSTYQMLVNLDWQAIRMADYAIKVLGADTAAIITPTSTDNLRMAREFKNRFEDLGGTVLGVEYFRVRDNDFGPYVRDLKELIIGDLLDSIVFVNEDGDTIEAEEVPVSVDCMYIPANGSQLRQLLPQINFYNLNTVYLGGDGWGNDVVYQLGDRITKECYFSSGLIEDYVSDKASDFAQRFDRRHGRQPGRLEKIGYDAVSLICEAFNAGKFTRSEISDYLSGIKGFDGVNGKITFGPNRENIELPIYKIENEQPVRVNLE